jgi:hypothetical protein
MGHAQALDSSGLVTSSTDEILRFIASSFRSVWALELLLMLKREQHPWSHQALVSSMRASDLVVTRALAALEAAGLVTNEGGQIQYLPVSKDVAGQVDEAEALYAKRPDAVRRAIIGASSEGASAFANAFKLRKD